MLGLTMKTAMGELELIERIRSGWAAGAGAARGHARDLVLGIGDDCAILRPPQGHEVLVTTDFTLEGRHFRRDWHPPESVGHRALARGLSDLAAMGARPLAVFLSLALPGEMLATASCRRWIERFFIGLRSLADQFAVPLAGGDTSESPCGLVLADIVLVGSAPAGRALRRSGAHAGDALYVTGELGGAAAELSAMERRGKKWQPTLSYKAREDGPPGFVAHPQMFPEPRLAVGLELLRRRLATAAIDLSDGLSTDLAHLCCESGVGAEVSAAALPIHPLALHAPDRAIDLALHGGEDYELLFAAPARVRMPRSLAGVRITRIGSLVAGKAVSLVDSAGRRQPLKPGGWEHFTGRH
ncbi:MAG: thiamine-phosphate kinase [Acidobacteriaceae bacterium]|jgi:thiamine-monophosphate kinase